MRRQFRKELLNRISIGVLFDTARSKGGPKCDIAVAALLPGKHVVYGHFRTIKDAANRNHGFPLFRFDLAFRKQVKRAHRFGAKAEVKVSSGQIQNCVFVDLIKLTKKFVTQFANLLVEAAFAFPSVQGHA